MGNVLMDLFFRLWRKIRRENADGLNDVKKVAFIRCLDGLEESFKDFLTFSCGIKKQVLMADGGKKCWVEWVGEHTTRI